MLATRRHIGAMNRLPWVADSAALQSRSNSIRNNSGEGASLGTPGTDPTNWGIPDTTDGVSSTIVALGIENRIDCIDIRFAGTISVGGVAVTIVFETTSEIVAADGQTWAQSMFLSLRAGSFSNISTAALSILTLTSGGASIAANLGSELKSALTSTLARFSNVATATATTAYVQPRFRFVTGTAGQAVDFTIRMGWPQLHLGSSALSPIRTTGIARTGVHVSAGR